MIKRNPRIIKRNIEIWKPIKGFPKYEISNLGRLKSLGTWIPCGNSRRFLKERIRKNVKFNTGYYTANLRSKGKVKGRTIHSLVITHFGLPQPSPKHQCNHKDGNKLNNWWSNLEWVTHSENAIHASKMGLLKPTKGELNGNAKLTEKQIKQIKKLYKNKIYNQYALGDLFNVTQATISLIICNKTWNN